MAHAEMIVLNNVSKYYQQGSSSFCALDAINLSVEPGSITGIIGHSGAGKSTLLRCINCLERPSTGQIFVAGEDMLALSKADLRKMRQQIGMIFQQFHLLSSRDVYQNIAFSLEIIGKDKKTIQATIEPLLELTGLTDKRHAHVDQLSGGQRQRVAIARALATHPSILLCDEATSALDPQTTQSILHLLKEINQRLNITIVLITHDMQVIKQVAQQVIVMDKGRIVESGQAIAVFGHATAPATQALIHETFHDTMPDYLQLRLSPTLQPDKQHVLLHCIFVGESAEKPLIAQISAQYGVSTNILEAHLETIQATRLGFMVLELQTANAALIQQILQFLQLHQVKVEVLGYV